MKKFLLSLFVLLLTASAVSFGQAISQNGGSIQGTITDPTGAIVSGATIVISDPATGYTHTLTSDKSGYYSLGPLTPGDYMITVTAPSFEKLAVKTVVRVGTVTSGNEKLTVGSAAETVEVNAGSIQVNTEQVGVAGVVTKEQIDTLPINGRNILDIAQVQPGVILQSGQTFDPTKSGYSAISVNGQNGRSTRVLLDGQDISDETVGTVVYNVPEGAVGELQLNRSTQDVSGSVTSTGQVLIATNSGTNTFHGNAFYNFQDYREGFANVSGKPAPFQRNQFGGYVGGPVIKDKLFFFGGIERIKQDDSSPVGTSTYFSAIFKQYPNVKDPFRDTFSMLRLDYNAPWGVHLFARATYSVNAAYGNSGFAPYSVFKNQDNVPGIVGGADFTTGKFTHSVRFGYLKFINDIADGVAGLGSSIYNPSAALGFQIELVGGIDAGQNELAPQATYQSSKQFRYDGTWTKGAHSIKFGGEFTRILQGGFAPFFGGSLFTDVSTSSSHRLATCAVSNPIGGLGADGGSSTSCLDDPINGYKPAEFLIGNGNGVFSERPGFGLPGGGQFSWRMGAYVGDTWKATSYLTLVAGLRWSVDTDRANQDVPTPTCGEVDPSLAFAGCGPTSNPNNPLFDQFGPGLGLGKSTQQNWANFGPQVGFVFSPGSHKLAIRGGAGIYYENNLFNNGSNARTPVITAAGQYFNYGESVYYSPSIFLPGLGTVTSVNTTTGAPNCTVGAGCDSISQLYTLSVGQAATIVNKLKTVYDTASKVNAPNTSFIGTGGALVAANIYGGPYKTPYSIQLNGGMQYELKKGLVLSVDFIHNATLKVPLTIDTNHQGAARTLNTAAATAAIGRVASEYGCTTTGTAQSQVTCAISRGAALGDFTGAGLDSAQDVFGGTPAQANCDLDEPTCAYAATPNTGAAFAGYNANVGTGDFILPVGKSAYDALQIVVQQQKTHPLPGIVSSNMQISYNLSRAVTNSGGGSNQFFAGAGPYDQDCVNCFIGRNDLDKSNQLSLSASLGIKYGLQVGFVGHFFSAPPSTLDLSAVAGTPIYNTDVNGDGLGGDLLPGQLPGSYGHSVKGNTLAKTIANYNATQVGTLTPAGQALVSAGLFTTNQLTTLGATLLPLQPAPANAITSPPTRTFDASVSYPIKFNKFHEGLAIIPGFVMYNVTNMSNFGGYGTLEPLGTSTAGALNGPNSPGAIETTRVLRGSGQGTFDQGGPRTSEFQLKVTF